MKIRTLYAILGLFAGGIILNSCVKKPVYPSEPVIEYTNFLRYGNDALNPDSVELVISFTDNEGDIGLTQADTHGIYKTGNLIMTYYYLDTAISSFVPFDQVPATPAIDTLKIPFRVPVVLPEGDISEPVKGLIYAKLKKPSIAIHDKIMYKVQLFDLAGHSSNKVDTPAFDFDL